MPSRGLERRRHIVYVTRNSEYHCRDGECVAVRDRSSQSWLRDHPALRGKVMGSVYRQGLRPRPETGLRLLFTGRGLVVTSKLLCSGRPEREDIFYYTSLCRAGEIARAG